MKCSNCGNEISQGQRFCINCGAPVPSDQYEEQAAEPAAQQEQEQAPVQPEEPPHEAEPADAAAEGGAQPDEAVSPEGQEPESTQGAPAEGVQAQEPAGDAAPQAQEQIHTGDAQPEPQPQKPAQAYGMPVYSTSKSTDAIIASIPKDYKPLSIGQFFGFEVLFSLPFIGVIASLIFALDVSKNVNLTNFAKARFLWTVVKTMLELFIVLILLMRLV